MRQNRKPRQNAIGSGSVLTGAVSPSSSTAPTSASERLSRGTAASTGAPSVWGSAWALARHYGPPAPLAVVLGLYVLAAFIIPTTADVAISDDWTYVRSVEILHETGDLSVLPVAAAAVVFQTIWAGAFTEIFGMSLGVVRLATISLVFLSGIAMYGLARELGVDQRRSALGAGVYLFNPLAFVIGYSFMSDPYFTAMLTISTYFLVKGLRPDAPSPGATVLGSVAISCAFLVRVHGMLILLAALIYLFGTARLRRDRVSVKNLACLITIPALTVAWYYLIFARGLPSQQDLFWGQAKDAWFDEAWLLVQRLTFLELIYGGLFILPISAGALLALRSAMTFRWRWAWAFFLVWGGILLYGVQYFADDDTRLLDRTRHVMPYIPHFLGRAGLGAGDLRSARPDVVGDWFWNWLTGICVVASLVLALILARRIKPGSPVNGGPAGFLVILGVLQAGGVLPQSLLFRNWVISLDRYLLPLLPMAIALALWALKDLRFSHRIAWPVLALIAAISIASTRDALVFQRNVWRMAEYANGNLGIPNTRLDAGYAWNSYHLWEYGYANGIPVQSPNPYGTWWTDTYAPATDSSYIVAGAEQGGYTTIFVLNYSQWLQSDETTLYLMRRNDVPGPP